VSPPRVHRRMIDVLETVLAVEPETELLVRELIRRIVHAASPLPPSRVTA